jgi:hypothetical protein
MSLWPILVKCLSLPLFTPPTPSSWCTTTRAAIRPLPKPICGSPGEFSRPAESCSSIWWITSSSVRRLRGGAAISVSKRKASFHDALLARRSWFSMSLAQRAQRTQRKTIRFKRYPKCQPDSMNHEIRTGRQTLSNGEELAVILDEERELPRIGGSTTPDQFWKIG